MLVSIAINYMSMNMPEKAKELLLKAIAVEPQNIQVLFHLAQVYNFEKNYENAKKLLEDAYTLAPNTEIANLLAQVYYEIGEYSRAYALYNIVNLTIPNNLGVLMNLARCKFAQKEYAAAKEHLETLLKILPEHEEAIEMLNKIKEEEIK